LPTRLPWQAVLWIVEVNDLEAAFGRATGKLFPPLPPDTDNDQDHAEEDDRRQHDPDEEIRIRMGTARKSLDNRQKDD